MFLCRFVGLFVTSILWCFTHTIINIYFKATSLALHKMQLLLQTEYSVSACVCVCLLVTFVSHANPGWTEWDVVWGTGSFGPKVDVATRGDQTAMRPFVKILWALLTFLCLFRGIMVVYLRWFFSRWLLRVDLIKWVSNVCPPVRTSVRLYVRPSVHKEFLRFPWNLVCR